jgi:lipoprotein-anchoring transpeptidase ErfK/SrfK
MGSGGLYRAASIAVALTSLQAQAYTNVHIDLSTQTMHVTSSSGSYTWPVSTARAGYVTPRGSFSPKSLQSIHYSRKYDNSPMPHSIFFSGGYAIHGSYATDSLGSPASHGCVRLSPGHAAQLFHMIQSEGGHITISGSPPRGRERRDGLRRRGRAQPGPDDAGPNSLFEIFGN